VSNFCNVVAARDQGKGAMTALLIEWKLYSCIFFAYNNWIINKRMSVI